MSAESDLLLRVLDALWREDHLGLHTNGSLTGQWWEAPLPDGRVVRFPVRPDGFLADHAVAEPRLVVGERVLTTLTEVLAELAPRNDEEAEAGWASFTEECAQTLATVRLHDAARPELYAKVDPGATGFSGLLDFEALAALRDHPVHPTGRCRWGMSESELRRYAPEFLPSFRLQWTAVPREKLNLSPALAGELPGWWPDLEGDDFAVPVHPLTVERLGLSTVDLPGLDVTPTLSTRTVALHAEPGTHLKLPLPTATLGARNKRSIKPGTLADGDAVHRLLQKILDRESGLAANVLLADESAWLDSADEMLAVLIRRYPAEIANDTLVPAAALLAEDPHRPESTLLDRFSGGDVEAWFDSYLTALLDWHVALWLRYGVALESHQQNITVAFGQSVRLVYKDDDGARIDRARLEAALGEPAGPFADERIAVSDPAELADMFTTITLHLCVAAPIVASGRRSLFALARRRLEEAVERWHDPADAGSRAAVDLLRRKVLDADRLPIKAMVTSGTLLPKHRLGCTDINKHYRYSGPNYLRGGSDVR
ncbi:hypothetical protein Lesp02_22720 [Lentzea sp. NBRC 105346]|uniref:IucA/IucC family protein n=1 Tax=Lentzea sp. NBRC 105346 TaxID=3032205 RepID=UPI0024A47DAC|nr:IucA/IucC family protein [Lentzea sp. NBRC 105346]GLZ30082.1 hypothetical protein Lesp02_22720 [Lentzea sp. NBRC 105346]